MRTFWIGIVFAAVLVLFGATAASMFKLTDSATADKVALLAFLIGSVPGYLLYVSQDDEPSAKPSGPATPKTRLWRVK